MASTDELSLMDKGISFPVVSEALQSFVSENKKRPKVLSLNKNSAIGVEGTISIAETWLEPERDNEDVIQTLNIASCSVGRCINPATGANMLTDKALLSLGAHGHRLQHLDLSWNDLNEEAIRSLVWGLLDIKGPSFEAEDYNPATLKPSRGCALESLTLKGNSICDEGVEWLARLLEHPESKLNTLDLTQCALQENGAEVLCRVLTSDSSPLTSLDLRENDVKSWSKALASAAVKSSKLTQFCGLNFSDLNETLKKGFGGESVSLAAGKNAMCHGALALLLCVRPYIVSEECQGNPLALATGSTTGVNQNGTMGGISIDFKDTQICGFYWEETEVIDELIDQLALSSTQHISNAQDNKAPEIMTKQAADSEGQLESEKKLTIQLLEFNDESGASEKQLREILDSSGPKDQRKTVVKFNGEELKEKFSCVIS